MGNEWKRRVEGEARAHHAHAIAAVAHTLLHLHRALERMLTRASTTGASSRVMWAELRDGARAHEAYIEGVVDTITAHTIAAEHRVSINGRARHGARSAEARGE